jgi:hypothetical protein
MKRLKAGGGSDLGALGLSVAATLAAILVLGVFAGHAFPGMPGAVMSVALGWSTALALGAISRA